MSAPLPHDERADEALRRAQRAHEPSMEEILASIRAIIADDKANAATTAAAARPAPAAGSQVIYSNFGQKAAEAVQPVPTPTVVWSRPEEPEGQFEAEAVEPEEEVVEPAELHAETAPAPNEANEYAYEQELESEEDPLLSAQADRQIGASLRTLAASLAIPDPRRVEEMTRELLRPMMKVWLDENLPSLVERLVRAEIQRIARGGR
jgi:uncharacterized protein